MAFVDEGIWRMAFISPNMQDDLRAFIDTKVQERKLETGRNIETALEILKVIFARLQVNEPRFQENLQTDFGRVKGLRVINPDHIELRLYLEQIDLFTTIQSGAPEGATFLDIKDERSRIRCIWAEFLTASGHLSARKIREKFQVLLTQAVNRITWINENVYVSQNKAYSRLRINEKISVDIFPCFRCLTLQSNETREQPLSIETKTRTNETQEFELIPRETGNSQPYSTDRDAWCIEFTAAEDGILQKGNRKLCLSILKTIFNKKFTNFIVQQPAILRTVLLYVCEKHPKDSSWADDKLQDRINSVLLQLVACLQSRSLPHYYLKGVNLLAAKSSRSIRGALEDTWKLARDLCTNENFFKVV